MEAWPEGFDPFVRRHASALAGLARALAGNREDAEDLLQETFLIIYRKWSKVDGARNPISYARRILINTFVSMGRRRRLRTIPLIGELHTGCSEDHALDTRDVVLRMIEELPYRQRAVLALRYLDDSSDDEIANVLNCRTSTVRSLAKRALDHLRIAITNEELDRISRSKEKI
jgi:RNA polymerase sigma-70 factor (sigma-E family)